MKSFTKAASDASDWGVINIDTVEEELGWEGGIPVAREPHLVHLGLVPSPIPPAGLLLPVPMSCKKS